ncbi:hypothetical protein STEG23_030074, partial [Scotinomys teguina]
IITRCFLGMAWLLHLGSLMFYLSPSSAKPLFGRSSTGCYSSACMCESITISNDFAACCEFTSGYNTEENDTRSCSKQGRGWALQEPTLLSKGPGLLGDVFLYAVNMGCSHWLINKAALAYGRCLSGPYWALLALHLC